MSTEEQSKTDEGQSRLTVGLGMEVQIRDTCPQCKGTGEAMSQQEAIDRARKHNQAASRCNMGGNYLSAENFIECGPCDGTGKVERWISVAELLATPNAVLSGAAKK